MTQTAKQKLVDAFRDSFGGQVDAEDINGRGRYRFEIVSSAFSGVAQLTRQDQAWEVVDRTLSRAESADISLILTYDPADLSIV